MKRRRSKVRRTARIIAHAVAAALFVIPAAVRAQSVALILPIGARTVGMGMAAAASVTGSESPWWNPALVARSPRDVALQIQTNVNPLSTADLAGGVVYPVPPVGSVAVFFRYVGYGTLAATDSTQAQTGAFAVSNSIIGATFATTFSSRFAAGFTLKRLLISFNCSGSCPQIPTSSGVAALDFGSQAFVFSDSSLSVAITLLNVGPRLPIRDAPQADQLPVRGTLGIAYTPKMASDVKDVRVTAAADVVNGPDPVSGKTLGYRFGAEITYLNRLKGRGGYFVNGPNGVDGATLGGGIVSDRLQIDIAQMLTNLSSSSARPTMISIRYVF